MPQASGSRHSLGYVKETVFGTTPANPAFKAFRHNSTTLNLNRSAFGSDELRSDRMIADWRAGTRSVEGNIVGELSRTSHDDMLAAALCGTWRVSTTGSTSLSSTTTSFDRAAGSFITDGFTVGDTVVSSGFVNAGNNGEFSVTSVGALSLGVSPLAGQVRSAEVAAAGRTVVSRGILRAGSVRDNFTLERSFADVNEFLRYRGAQVDTLQLSMTTGAVVGLTFGFWAKAMDVAQSPIAGATYPAAPVTPTMDAISGAVMEGGSAIAVATEITLNLSNNLNPRFVIGSAESLEPSIGRSSLTGTLSAYFESSTLYQKFLTNANSSLEIVCSDGVDTFTFLIPRLKYTGGDVPVGGEGPVSIQMPFQGILDPVTGTNFQITRSAP